MSDYDAIEAAERNQERNAAQSARIAELESDNAKLHEAVLGTICDPSSVHLNCYSMAILQAVRNLGKRGTTTEYTLIETETLSLLSDRIAELEKQVERVRVELKSWAMRLGYRDSDTHAFDYITFIHAKAAEVSAERDRAVSALKPFSEWMKTIAPAMSDDLPKTIEVTCGELRAAASALSPTTQEGR